jgi:Tol biopolymer transport system component
MTIPKLPILIATVAASLAAAPVALAAFPGKNGLIAFQKSKGGALVKDIYVMSSNGKHQTDITKTPKVSETDPSFSPNGRKLVFAFQTSDYKHAGIGVINADGSGMHRIVSGSPDEAVLQPSWTKDGRSIVFTRFQGTNPPSHVYVVSAKGGKQRQLTFGDVQDFNPIASPVTGLVAYLSYPPGSQATELLVGLDGTVAGQAGEHQANDWSPDGKRFIFERDHDIYASASDGTGLVKLAGLPAVDEAPVWSPDGKKFIFTSEGRHDIFVANADGSGLKNLTHAPGFEHDASWGVATKGKQKHH